MSIVKPIAADPGDTQAIGLQTVVVDELYRDEASGALVAVLSNGVKVSQIDQPVVQRLPVNEQVLWSPMHDSVYPISPNHARPRNAYYPC